MLQKTERKARLLVQGGQSFSKDALNTRSTQCSEDVVDTEIPLGWQSLTWRDGSFIGEQVKYAQHEDDPTVRNSTQDQEAISLLSSVSLTPFLSRRPCLVQEGSYLGSLLFYSM